MRFPYSPLPLETFVGVSTLRRKKQSKTNKATVRTVAGVTLGASLPTGSEPLARVATPVTLPPLLFSLENILRIGQIVYR